MEYEFEVVERYLAGETLQQLSSTYGCSEPTVGRVLKKHKTPLRSGGAQAVVSPTQLSDMVRLYQEGFTTKDLGTRFGVTSRHVWRLLRRQGISTRKVPKIPPEQVESLARRYREGESLNTLAQECNCTARTVAKALTAFGVSMRKRGGITQDFDSGVVQAVLDLHTQGCNQVEISTQLGVSVLTVSRVQRDRNLNLKKMGSNHPFWKGGRAEAEGGYKLVLMPADHPFAEQMRRSNGYCLEHRLVMAESLGRPLRGDESVHHIDGDPSNNSLDNLQLRQGQHGKGGTHRCLDCGSHNVTPIPLGSH